MAQTGEITLNKIPELLKKIDLISNDDFEQLTSTIYEALKASIEGKAKPSDKQLPYLDNLVDLYIQSPSERVLKVLVGLPMPLNEHLFTILLNKITSNNHNVKNRQSVLILISKIVHVTPVWLSQIITQNRLNHFFSILRNDEEVVTLGASALCLVEMLVTLPSVMSHAFGDIFSFFSRLADFVLKCQEDKNDANFLHINAILYRFFFRLYAMYPCNFVSFLHDHYGLGCTRRNSEIFKKIIEPMLSNFRFHPLLISSSKEKECDKERWFYKEAHDHVDDCLRYAIDPIELFSEANDLGSEENYDEDADDDEELCKLTNSTPDEDKLTPISREKQLSSETSPCDVDNDHNRNAIFNQLNESITNDWRNVTLLDKTDSQPETGATSALKATAEYAEEAISLSKKTLLKNGTVESAQKNFSMRSSNKPVIAPVAIDPVSKAPSLGALQRNNINKQVCVSPFKPIRENDGYDIKSLNSKSPANYHSNLSHSLGAATTTGTLTSITATEDTEELDLEIMELSYNRENKQSDFTKNNGNIPLRPEVKKKADLAIGLPSDTVEQVISSNNKQFDELVGNIKNSFKKANSRIRYQSHCLPETEKEHSDYYISSESRSGLSSASRILSKSCPILYFSDVQEKRLSVDDNVKASSQLSNSSVAAAGNSNQTTDGKTVIGKTNVNLENPAKRIQRSASLKKTSKSVDHTKEARHLFHSRHESFSQFHRQYPSIDSKGRNDLYDSSIDIPRKTDPMHWKYTPHEMLDQMLLLNFEQLNVKKSDQSDTSCQLLKNSRDSALNTGSSTSSMEQMFSANRSLKSTEEGLRKQLMFMTLHLMFERHQRDLVVLRNRKLYKNLKESIKLEEQLRASRQLIEQMETEQGRLEEKLKDKLYDYCHYRKAMKNQLAKTENELDELKGKCQQLEIEHSQMEKRYTEEIKSLQENYRMIDTELKKYQTSFEGKNSDLVKLSDENSDLKRRLFVYGEFYNKLRDSYMQSRNVTTDLNEKLCIDALKNENSLLNKQIAELTCHLEVCKDRCSTLEKRLNQQEAQTKMRMESQDTQYFKDLLKSKDTRIKSLETTVINFEKHIHALNGQMNDRL